MSEVIAPAAPAKKSKKLLIIALAGLILAGGAGGGAWYMLGSHGKPRNGAVAEEKHAPKKQLFTTLDTFTVNLQDPRGERFAQVGITLQFEDPAIEMNIKDQLPAVRNEILLLISSKQVEELLSIEGKRKLADEVRERAGRAIGFEPPAKGASAPHGGAKENPVRGVLFSQFIVQ